jgi:hypothetical protein
VRTAPPTSPSWAPRPGRCDASRQATSRPYDLTSELPDDHGEPATGRRAHTWAVLAAEARPDGADWSAPAELASVRRATAALTTVDLDGHSTGDLGRLAVELQTEIDRLTVLRDRIAGVLRRRSVTEAGPGRERGAVLQATRELAARLGLSPSEAKQAAERGRTLEARPELATALTGPPPGAARGADAAPDGTSPSGRPLRPDQIALIGGILDEVPLEQQDRVEAELLAAAATQHAVELRRTARRLLARLDARAADRAEERRHRRRTASACETADGMTTLHGQFSGLDAEVVRTALAAFATPDAPGETPRTPGQRTADALVAALRAALDAGAASADRQVRPHLLITVAHDDLRAAIDGDGGGVAELAWSGPIPARQIRRLVSEATIRVVGLDIRGLPIAMSQAVAQPTAALYLALTARDGGCRYPGCDAPPPWCDVAHATARRHRGPLTLENAILLCRRHHRRIDLGDWTIRIDGWDATFTAPNGRVLDAGPARGRPPDPGRTLADEPPRGGPARCSHRPRDGHPASAGSRLATAGGPVNEPVNEPVAHARPGGRPRSR